MAAPIAPTTPPHHPHQNNNKLALLAFWMMGLLNNSCFVIMISGAKSISEGGTALVFIANTLPSLLIKLSVPYWFHLVKYNIRLLMTSILFISSFCTVAFFANFPKSYNKQEDLEYELIGVALGSLGGGIGEASLLALAGRYHSGQGGGNITAFSSGTGLAGAFGFAWTAFWNNWIGLTFTNSLLLANGLAISYYAVFSCCLREDNDDDVVKEERTKLKLLEYSAVSPTSQSVEMAEGVELQIKRNKSGYEGISNIAEEDNYEEEDTESPLSRNEINPNETFDTSRDDLDIVNLTTSQRFRLVSSFWPYMIPLFTVYFAEYALQSGSWTAIGFPVDDVTARNKFYEYGNWMYQIGVFLSRSSGTIYHASLRTLWILPFLQVLNLILFSLTAVYHFWYDWSLLSLCFFAGLLVGGVYVNAYTRINADMSSEKKEFALASASVADSFGVLIADVCGLYLQSCLYDVNGIEGAVVKCPVKVT